MQRFNLAIASFSISLVIDSFSPPTSRLRSWKLTILSLIALLPRRYHVILPFSCLFGRNHGSRPPLPLSLSSIPLLSDRHKMPFGGIRSSIVPSHLIVKSNLSMWKIRNLAASRMNPGPSGRIHDTPNRAQVGNETGGKGSSNLPGLPRHFS